jgi:hypothetical protein
LLTIDLWNKPEDVAALLDSWKPYLPASGFHHVYRGGKEPEEAEGTIIARRGTGSWNTVKELFL